MPSFSDILEDLKQDPTCAWAANTFLEVRRLAGLPESIGLTRIDSLLSDLQPIVSVAAQLDQLYSPYWHDLELNIPEVRNLLRARYQDGSIWKNPNLIQLRIKVGEFPTYTALISAAPLAAGNRLLPLKALLLIGNHANEKYFWDNPASDNYRSIWSSQDIRDLTDRLRKYSDPTWHHFHLLTQNVPEWRPEDIEGWTNDIQRNVGKLPRTWGNAFYSGRTEHFFVLTSILRYVTDPKKIQTRLQNSVASQPLPGTDDDSSKNFVVRPHPLEPQFNAITGSELRAKKSFDFYSWQHPTSEADNDATAPEIRSASPQEEIGPDEPEKTQAISALETRYTNYRTAMDNQRLPWTWDCCNPLEVRSLVCSLINSKAQPDIDDNPYRLLVWLTLVTGQPLSEILDFVVGDCTLPANSNGLIQGTYWRRQIPYPPQAYRPKPHQGDHLSPHTYAVDFLLPEPVIQLSATLGLQQISPTQGREFVRLGKVLNTDCNKATEQVRKILEVLRGRDLRFLIGRVRKVLGKEVMCVSHSPVLTHLITALPTDAPPSGVYYSAFPVERLQAVYNEAIGRIFQDTR